MPSLLSMRSQDSYGKHKDRYEAFYQRMFPDVGIQVEGESKLGNAVGAVGKNNRACWTRITGDPGHECFAFRRCLSVHANDRHDLEADHAQALAELSAPMKTCTCGQCDKDPTDLEEQCHTLLRAAITLPQSLWLQQVQKNNEALQPLKTWLEQAHVDRSRTWVKLFQALPPRGVVQRLGRRLGASVHASCKFQGHATLRKFRTQLRRIKKWCLVERYQRLCLFLFCQ